MLAKVTTADCLDVLNDMWPPQYGADHKGLWTQMYERVRAPRSIVRMFHHQSLPLVATVIETYGSLGGERHNIRPSFAWDPSIEWDTDAALKARSESESGQAFLASEVKPELFFFALTENAVYPGWTFCALVPQCFYLAKGRQWEQPLSQYVLQHLPDGSEETAIGIFALPLGIDAARAELQNRGFKHWEKFQRFMDVGR